MSAQSNCRQGAVEQGVVEAERLDVDEVEGQGAQAVVSHCAAQSKGQPAATCARRDRVSRARRFAA